MNDIRASIDIGSNSTLLLILDVSTKNILCEKSEITSLGKDLDKNLKFRDDCMDSTFNALSSYVEACKEFGITAQQIIATATEASRVAQNSKKFYDRVQKELGLVVQLITGEAEAYYTALGVVKMSNISSKEVSILDVGGASSEIIKVQLNPFQILKTISLPIGSVRSTDWLAQGEFDDKLSLIFEKFSLNEYICKNLICVAGTLTTIALILKDSKEYNSELINESQINLSIFKDFLKKLKDFDDDSFLKFPFIGKRKASLYGGALTSSKIIEKMKVENISFSTYGLRYGTLIAGEIDERFKL